MAEKGKRGKLIGPSYFEELWGNEYIEVINDVPFAQENQKTMEKAKELLQRGQLDFLGIHFTAIKWIGKAKGPFSAEYKEQIQELDVQLSLFYKWLEKNGFLTDTVLIITSTHGLSAGGAHGHLDEGERYVPFILHGPMFRKGKQVSIPHQLTSVAPTIAYLLGVEAPKQARGKLMVEEMR
jgi:phosphopentomutase